MSIRILQYIQYNISSVYYLHNVLMQIGNCSIKYNIPYCVPLTHLR